MRALLGQVWENNDAQDIAEYALMLAVILVIVVSVMTAIGVNINTIFTRVRTGLTPPR